MSFGLVNKEPENDDDLQMPDLKSLSPDEFRRAVYVAGASSEIERADAVMAQLRASGMIVTSTWVDNIRKVGAANPMTAPRKQRELWSAVDLHEVSQAAFLLLLLPSAGVATSGAWVELGYSLALQQVVDMGVAAGQIPPQLGRTLICAGEERSIFSALCEHYASDDEAVRAILESL